MTSDTALRSIPDLTLPRGSDGVPTRLRTTGRENTVLILLHSAACRGCIDYLRSLVAAREGLQDWDGRVVAVVPAGVSEAGRVREAVEPSFLVLADPDGRCREACGVGGGSIIIADQWGEVFHVYAGEPDSHDFPAPDEVVEWLRFLAIQCPECQGEAL